MQYLQGHEYTSDRTVTLREPFDFADLSAGRTRNWLSANAIKRASALHQCRKTLQIDPDGLCKLLLFIN
jgi:hypothetical protein